MHSRTRALAASLLAAALGLGLAGCGEEPLAPKPSGSALGGVSPKAKQAGNLAPVIEQLTLDPSAPAIGETVTASPVVRDPEGDPVRVEYEWRVNGRVVAKSRKPTFASDDVAKGDRIEVTAVAHDGRNASEPYRRYVRIGNRLPLLEGVLLDVEPPVRPGREIVAVPEASDPDDDRLSFDYEWIVNGRSLGEGDRAFDTRRLRRGDQVRVRVVANDGSGESQPLESDAIRIANSPPQISLMPATQGEDGTFRYEFEASDPDGDRNLRFRLAEGPSGMSMDSLVGVLSWRPTAEQAGVHPVEVRVEDAHGDATALRFEVRVSATEVSAEDAPPASAP